MLGALGSALILGPILLTLNNASTVYVPPVTFQPVKQGAAVPAAAALPPFAEGSNPRRKISSSSPINRMARTPMVEGLDPGEYLVNASGADHAQDRAQFPA